MKKINKAFLFLSSIFLTSIIIQGCCTDEYRIIGDGFANIYSISNRVPIDTIREPFFIEAEFESEIAGSFHSTGLINTAFATSCEYKFVNELDTNTLVVVADQDFIFSGDTIRANSDFSNLAGINSELLHYPFRTLNIVFSEAFINEAIFEKSDYKFTFEIETDDGLKLSNEVNAFIDL